MHAKVDIAEDVCIGSAMCVRVAPRVFEIGEDGVARVKDDVSATAAELSKAIDICPTGALTVVE
jgi:ferredoxin